MKIISLSIIVLVVVAMSACGKFDSLAASEFSAACDQTVGCKLNKPSYNVDATSQIIRDDRGLFYLGTAICAERFTHIGETNESACVHLSSQPFILKSAVEERVDELTYQNIVASKEAWLRELPGVKYRF